MSVSRFDHVAIPIQDVDAMVRFYRSLGFSAPAPEKWHAAPTPVVPVQFGNNKINMHTPQLWQRPEMTLRGPAALPGCGDICFVWNGSIDDLRQTLRRSGAPIEVGPVSRIGGARSGTAEGTSVYARDPDQNLLEFIVYPPGRVGNVRGSV